MRIRTDSNVQTKLRYTRQGKVLVAVTMSSTSFTTAASRRGFMTSWWRCGSVTDGLARRFFQALRAKCR